MTERATARGIALLLACALAACDAGPASRADLAAHAQAARQPAELQVDGARIHASLAPTTSLSPAIAIRYGMTPERSSYLLLVGVRQGPLHEETSTPAQVTARARDLRGVWQDIAMREVRSDGFIDYVGAARATPPDTLAFEITVLRDDSAGPDTLRFSRDVFAP